MTGKMTVRTKNGHMEEREQDSGRNDRQVDSSYGKWRRGGEIKSLQNS